MASGARAGKPAVSTWLPSTALPSQLWVKDRDWASRGDYRDVGGSNTNGFTCEPATIRVTGVSSGTAPGGGQIFLSPDDTTPVANNAATNGVCNLSVYNSFIPSQYRANGVIRVVNDFSDDSRCRLRCSTTATRRAPIRSRPAQQRHRFRDSARGVAGQQNPFFTAPAGARRPPRKSSTGWRCAKTRIMDTPNRSRTSFMPTSSSTTRSTTTGR